MRERVSTREKYDIITSYYQDVTGESDKAVQQCELWIHDYPRDPDVHNNLATVYEALAQF